MADAAITRIGVIKPTTTSNSLNDLAALLPADVELVPEYMGFQYKSMDEFAKAMPIYAEKVASLAAQGVAMIHPEGAPPFMVQGRPEETRLIKEWEARHKVPVFTTGSTQVAAMRALGIERFAGFTPFSGPLAEAFRAYFEDAGFTVLAMGKPVADDADVYDLTTSQILEHLIAAFNAVPGGPQALYILGSGWRVFDIVDELEAAIGVPVLHPVSVRLWYILNMLGRAAPVAGHGRLAAEMPAFA